MEEKKEMHCDLGLSLKGFIGPYMKPKNPITVSV
jgi:hypothetical protein